MAVQKVSYGEAGGPASVLSSGRDSSMRAPRLAGVDIPSKKQCSDPPGILSVQLMYPGGRAGRRTQNEPCQDRLLRQGQSGIQPRCDPHRCRHGDAEETCELDEQLREGARVRCVAWNLCISWIVRMGWDVQSLGHGCRWVSRAVESFELELELSVSSVPSIARTHNPPPPQNSRADEEVPSSKAANNSLFHLRKRDGILSIFCRIKQPHSCV